MLVSPQNNGIIYFIGLGGIGMSGIAEVLHQQGYQVQGSDVSDSDNIRRLQHQGINVFVGHNAAHLLNKNISVVVISSDIKANNVELDVARSLNLPVIKRAEMLAELMRLKPSIAVAGTHGKTSTTSLGASVLVAGGIDPTIMNGGVMVDCGSNARMGAGSWILVEADESDGSFLKLPATIGIITNIDPDHMENYRDFEDLRHSFVTFIKNLPFYGLGIVCLDHPEVRAILPLLQDRRLVTYGTDFEADIRAENIQLHRDHSLFDVVLSPKAQKLCKGIKREEDLKNITLAMIGHHNVLNSLSIIAVALELQIENKLMRQGLQSFKGVGRRFTLVGDVSGVKIIDDYAHHPQEIRAVLNMGRLACSGRVIVVMQPHRYSRLANLYEDFCTCFDNLDHLILAPIYGAGETVRPEFTHQQLAQDIQARGQISVQTIDQPQELAAIISNLAKPGDMILCLGAGTISAWAKDLPQQLQYFQDHQDHQDQDQETRPYKKVSFP